MGTFLKIEKTSWGDYEVKIVKLKEDPPIGPNPNVIRLTRRKGAPSFQLEMVIEDLSKEFNYTSRLGSFARFIAPLEELMKCAKETINNIPDKKDDRGRDASPERRVIPGELGTNPVRRIVLPIKKSKVSVRQAVRAVSFDDDIFDKIREEVTKEVQKDFESKKEGYIRLFKYWERIRLEHGIMTELAKKVFENDYYKQRVEKHISMCELAKTREPCQYKEICTLSYYAQTML